MASRLYYGDNLDILRQEIGSESVDLVYLDPPFTSQASYNILFKAPSGEQAKLRLRRSRILGTGMKRLSGPSTRCFRAATQMPHSCYMRFGRS